jgi:hypothetical protein
MFTCKYKKFKNPQMKLSTFIGNPAYLAGAYVLFANTFLITTHFSPRNDRQLYAQLYVYVLMFAGLDLFKKQMGWEFPLPLIGLALNAYKPRPTYELPPDSDSDSDNSVDSAATEEVCADDFL